MVSSAEAQGAPTRRACRKVHKAAGYGRGGSVQENWRGWNGGAVTGVATQEAGATSMARWAWKSSSWAEDQCQMLWRGQEPCRSRVWIQWWRVAPTRAGGVPDGGSAERDSRKHAPKTRRASETTALTTNRKREALVACAAERRSSKAGHTEATQACCSRRATARCGENVSAVDGASPPAASGAAEAGWGEVKIGGAGGSPPVARAPIGQEVFLLGRTAGSPQVAAGSRGPARAAGAASGRE
jgi:hypothetical protein